MALPQGLDYNNSIKANSKVAGSYMMEVQPSNSRTFNMSSQCILEIPTRERTYADLESSTLTMTVVNGSGHTIELDTTVAGMIQRVTTRMSGSVISDIVDYNKLYNLLLDVQTSKEQRCSSMAIQSGNSNGEVVVCDSTGAVPTDSSPFSNITLPGLGTARKGKTVATTESDTFSHSLVGGLFSANRYIPLEMASSIELSLYFDTAVRAFVTNAGVSDSDITIKDVKLQFQVVELDPSTDAMVKGSGYDFMLQDWSSSLSTIESTATTHSVILPARYSKLKSLYHLFFDQGVTNDATTPSQSQRSRGRLGASSTGGELVEYSCFIAGKRFPQIPLTKANFFSKLLESFHVSPYDVHNISMSQKEWEHHRGLGAGVRGGFAVAQDLESIRNKGDSILAAMSTQGATVQPIFTFDTAPLGNMTAVHFAHFDVLCRIQDGLLQIST